MHQSGHERAHSMHTVQLSSRRAITPRARAAGASLAFGYCTVSAPWVAVRPSVRAVTPSPFRTPGNLGLGSGITQAPGSYGHLEDSGHHDVGDRQRDQHLPGEALELVLTEPRVGE